MAKQKKPRPQPRRKEATEPVRTGGSETGRSHENGEGTQAPPSVENDDEPLGSKFARVTVPRQLENPEKRKQWKLPTNDYERGPYIIELNMLHADGLPGAANAFLNLYAELYKMTVRPSDSAVAQTSPEAPQAGTGPIALPPEPVRIAKLYFRCQLSVIDWRKLTRLDEQRAAEQAGEHENPTNYQSIYRLWPDFPVKPQTDRSMATIKADAAFRSFAAAGSGITWAVIDSGIAVEHPHFGGTQGKHALRDPKVGTLHRCFSDLYTVKNGVRVFIGTLGDPDADPKMDATERQKLVEQHGKAALTDDYGHGTHVAGIIAGRAPLAPEVEICAFERQDKVDQDGDKIAQQFTKRSITERERLRGVTPECRLVSLKVLDDKGEGRSGDVIRALEYIREKINDDPKLLRVHGVNLSVGYEFDAEMFACGQSPLCAEVDRLVQADVVVVTAAGNTGYGTVAASIGASKVGLSNTINDPGNAALAITVGSTHRDSPHTYGVSYFSSKGPTGDGRLKPDLVAPGERITSCAAGEKLLKARGNGPATDQQIAYYVEDSGTSMAAPHVSGAIAAFLSIRREFIGKPLEVKRIFLQTATSLGRERYFEGHGLVDLMRAIQSI